MGLNQFTKTTLIETHTKSALCSSISHHYHHRHHHDDGHLKLFDLSSCKLSNLNSNQQSITFLSLYKKKENKNVEIVSLMETECK